MVEDADNEILLNIDEEVMDEEEFKNFALWLNYVTFIDPTSKLHVNLCRIGVKPQS